MTDSPVVAALDKVLREHRPFHDESDDATPEQPRILYWWNVPERRGIGSAMLKATLVWFVALSALVALIGALAN